MSNSETDLERSESEEPNGQTLAPADAAQKQETAALLPLSGVGTAKDRLVAGGISDVIVLAGPIMQSRSDIQPAAA